MLGSFREAMSDAAETLRRVFVDPPSHGVDLGLVAPLGAAMDPLQVQTATLDLGWTTATGVMPCLQARTPSATPMFQEARLVQEGAWSAWATGAKVKEVPAFQSQGVTGVAIPPLPRRTKVLRLEPRLVGSAVRRLEPGLRSPMARQLSTAFAGLRSQGGLAIVLGLPVAIQGEDWQALSKALWLRYSMQLVKTTGENIRNVDVLGLFRIPEKGIRELRHDPKRNRLLVALDAEAYGSARRLFILARRKADRSLVSCYLEET